MDIGNNANMFYIGDKEKPDAAITYTVRDKVMSINSTVVNPKLRGQGLAGIITKYALDYAKENEMKVQPICSYTVDYFNKHEEYKDIKA